MKTRTIAPALALLLGLTIAATPDDALAQKKTAKKIDSGSGVEPLVPPDKPIDSATRERMKFAQMVRVQTPPNGLPSALYASVRRIEDLLAKQELVEASNESRKLGNAFDDGKMPAEIRLRVASFLFTRGVLANEPTLLARLHSYRVALDQVAELEAQLTRAKTAAPAADGSVSVTIVTLREKPQQTESVILTSESKTLSPDAAKALITSTTDALLQARATRDKLNTGDLVKLLSLKFVEIARTLLTNLKA